MVDQSLIRPPQCPHAPQSQRDCVPEPRVGLRHAGLPWVSPTTPANPDRSCVPSQIRPAHVPSAPAFSNTARVGSTDAQAHAASVHLHPVSQRDTVYQPRAPLWVLHHHNRPGSTNRLALPPFTSAPCPNGTPYTSPEHRSGSSTTTTALGPPTTSLCHRSPPPRVPTGHRIPAQSMALGPPPPHHPRSVGTPYTSPEHRSGIAVYQPRASLWDSSRSTQSVRPPPYPTHQSSQNILSPTSPRTTPPHIARPALSPTRQSGQSGQYRHPSTRPTRN
jgi:hypothetical protein